MTKTVLHQCGMAILVLLLFGGIGHADYQTDENIYLGSIFEWNPQTVGSCRTNYVIVKDGIPVQNNLALGPPTGNGAGSRVYDCTAVGINGSAAWRWQTGYYIFNGPGDDFKTFEGSFAWGGEVDGLCCELGHIQASEDGVTWYYNSAEIYTINPDPAQNNGNYEYFAVQGLHGNNPTWANYLKDMQAYRIEAVNGVYRWVKVPDTVVPKDFKPKDPYLGGNGFDLGDFRSLEDDTPWPEGGKMYYVRLIDDDEILDGQDYAKPWRFGAQMHAAMGLNVMKETPAGDLDDDGDVDGDDMQIIRGALRTVYGDEGYLEAADFDADGDIDFSDYRLWHACYREFTSQ